MSTSELSLYILSSYFYFHKFAVEKLRIKFNLQFTAIQIWCIRVANRLQSFTSDLSLTELIKGPLPDNHRYFNVFSTASVA